MSTPPATVHRRRNALNGHWVLVSPHRTQRPWQGEQASAAGRTPGVAHDPHCYLCAGNARAEGVRNPDYRGPWVFTNDFPALLPEVAAPLAADDLFHAEPALGTCRVICYSEHHSHGLGQLPSEAVAAVVDTWCDESRQLGEHWAWVQVFENRGAMMGASNPHPHGQIWATAHLPDEAVAEDREQRAYFATHQRALLADCAEREAAAGERTVIETAHWLAVVPYWATWPFETLLICKQPVQRLPELDAATRQDLAVALHELIGRYDALFDTPFPYSMGWHGAPFDGQAAPHWRLHAHFYPPLLRSATVRKFMVGYEMLAEAQRDLTPEKAAARLRAARP